MKIDRKVAVKFLEALGFSKSSQWPEDKLKERLSQVPEKVSLDSVPEEHAKIYNELVESNGAVEIIPDTTAGDEEKPAEKSKKGKVEKAAKEPKSKKEKPAKTEKAAKEPKAKKEKPVKEEVEKDAFGNRVGSNISKICGVFTDDWKTVEDIAADSGLEVDQIWSKPLAKLASAGHIEKKICYRLKK